MSLEDRLERLAHRAPLGDPAEVLAAARHQAEGGRNQAEPTGRRLLAAAAAVLAVVALGAGALALAGADGDTVTVADGGERPDALDDFAPFEMTYETQSYQGGPLVSSTWRLTYDSWTGWELVLVEAGPGLAEEPGFRRVLSEGTLTEYNADGTVRSEERVDGPLAPLALMNKGPRTGPNDDNPSAYRHEYRSQQDHQCPDNPANGAPWCDEPGEVVEVELLEMFNEDGVPVYVSEHVPGTDQTLVLFNMLSYERTGSDGTDEGNPADEQGGVDGPVMYAPRRDADVMQQALTEGRLARQGDCLFMESGGEAAYPLRYLLLWPNGTYWDRDTQEVVVPGGVRVPLGAQVSADGGYLAVDDLAGTRQHPDVVARARDCTAGSGSTEVAYVQGDVEVAATVQGVSAPTYDLDLAGAELVEDTPHTAGATDAVLWTDGDGTYLSLVMRPGEPGTSRQPSGVGAMTKDDSFPADQGQAWLGETDDPRASTAWVVKPSGDLWMLRAHWYGATAPDDPEAALRRWALGIEHRPEASPPYVLDDSALAPAAFDAAGSRNARSRVWDYRGQEVTLLVIEGSSAAEQGNMLARGAPTITDVPGLGEVWTVDSTHGWPLSRPKGAWATLTLPDALVGQAAEIIRSLRYVEP